MPREHQKTEEGTDCGRRGFPSKTVFRRRLLADKVGEVLGIHAFPVDRVGTKTRGQEAPCEAEIVLACAQRRTEHVLQILSVALQPLVSVCGRQGRHGGWDDALPLQKVHEMLDALRGWRQFAGR